MLFITFFNLTFQPVSSVFDCVDKLVSSVFNIQLIFIKYNDCQKYTR